MKLRTIGLRVSGVIFGLVSLGLIARLWARSEIFIGGYNLGRIPSLFVIIVTGGLSIWLARLAGPWCTETKEPPTPKS
jgi:hypothetical protein